MNELMGVLGTDLPEIMPLITPLIDGVTNYLGLKESSKTQRAEIRARTRAALALLKNRRMILASYLDCKFSERGVLFDKYFSLIEKALESGDEELLRSALDGITQVYCSNPAEGVEQAVSQCSTMNDYAMEG